MFNIIFVLFLSTTAINGEEITYARLGELPYMVSLTSGWHVCGGSIINEEFILTAATCVTKPYYTTDHIRVQYGMLKNETRGPNIVKITAIILYHNKYTTYAEDKSNIALLKLEKKLKFSATVEPVILPIENQEFPAGTHARFSGWGKLKKGQKYPGHLHYTDLITLSDEECKKRNNGRTGVAHICTYTPKGGKAPCAGDLGSPLVVNGVQIGISSLILKDCGANSMGGEFTKVSHYIKWINKVLTHKIKNQKESEFIAM